MPNSWKDLSSGRLDQGQDSCLLFFLLQPWSGKGKVTKSKTLSNSGFRFENSNCIGSWGSDLEMSFFWLESLNRSLIATDNTRWCAGRSWGFVSGSRAMLTDFRHTCFTSQINWVSLLSYISVLTKVARGKKLKSKRQAEFQDSKSPWMSGGRLPCGGRNWKLI